MRFLGFLTAIALTLAANLLLLCLSVKVVMFAIGGNVCK